MTELRFEEKVIPSVDLSGESPLPAMRNALSFNLDYETGDEAGLFIGYGLDKTENRFQQCTFSATIHADDAGQFSFLQYSRHIL